MNIPVLLFTVLHNALSRLTLAVYRYSITTQRPDTKSLSPSSHNTVYSSS